MFNPLNRKERTSVESLITPSKFEDKRHLNRKESQSLLVRHSISFANAWNGILIAVRTQPNFRVHVAFFIAAVSMGIIFEVSVIEYMAILLSSALVFAMEMANTALEAVGDELAKGKYRELVGVAKDVAAGAVLISAINAIIIGLLIFSPKLLALLL